MRQCDRFVRDAPVGLTSAAVASSTFHASSSDIYSPVTRVSYEATFRSIRTATDVALDRIIEEWSEL